MLFGPRPSWSRHVARQDGRERPFVARCPLDRKENTTMALPPNTSPSYAAIGNREALSDVISRIDPADTPFMTACEREKASAVNHEWQTQETEGRGNSHT